MSRTPLAQKPDVHYSVYCICSNRDRLGFYLEIQIIFGQCLSFWITKDRETSDQKNFGINLCAFIPNGSFTSNTHTKSGIKFILYFIAWPLLLGQISCLGCLLADVRHRRLCDWWSEETVNAAKRLVNDILHGLVAASK